MRKVLLFSTLAATLAVPALAQAQAATKSPHDFSGNLTLASEYLYRGIAQTRGKPALQGGIDYAHASGLYLGAWGSNISWISDNGPVAAGGPNPSAGLELDLYGGYKGSITGDLGYDVGILTYNYPGTNKPGGAARPDTTELYAGLSYKWFSIKYSSTTTSLFGWTRTANAADKTKGSGYLDLTGTFDLGSGFGLVAHVGHQSVKGRGSASYSDWKLGLTRELGFGTLGVAVSDTNAKDNCAAGQDYCFGTAAGGAGAYQAGKGRVLVTFAKTF